MSNIHTDKILILDFGAQYTQLIARRIRELGVYCEIWAWDHDPSAIAAFGAKGIILSGGPESTTLTDAPLAPQAVFDAGVPILGICYGMQTLAAQLGGATEAAHAREFGHARVEVVAHDRLLAGLSDYPPAQALDVWMSHGDHVATAPPGFVVTARTERIPVAAMANDAKRWYGVQFHPEVTHTKQGSALLERFVTDICGCATLWTAANIIDDQISRVRAQVGDDHVLLGLSGGVDSSVVAALLQRAIGERLTCVFVDTGLLRWKEGDQVMAMFAAEADNGGMGVKVIRVNAADRFFSALAGVADPEAKRKIIGGLFVEIFDEEAHKLEGVKWLA
ncbi:MAG: glutamine-hydrolyzing GMP synthase, partial [Dokdonella sp.]